MNKIKKIFSGTKFCAFLLFLIIFAGFLIRLYGCVNSGGLWFDEIWSHYIARESFPFGILNKLYTEDVHAPLYFFALHFWMKLFSDSELSLRLLSILSGTLIIPFMYLIGKELESKKTGFIMAVLACTNPLLIHYSSEVRLYSMLALLGTLSVLFLIKIEKNPNKWNYTGFIASNLAIAYTFTLGFVFTLLQFFIYSVYLFFKKKNNLKIFVFAQAITMLLFLPYLPVLIHHLTPKPYIFINYFYDFNIYNLLSIFQSWFTPYLQSLYFSKILIYKLSIKFFVFLILPFVIYIFAIFAALSRNKMIRIIFLSGIMFFLLEMIASMLGKMLLLSRYTILMVPAIIATAGYGLAKTKFQKSALLMLIIVLATNLSFLPHKNSYRDEGLRPLGPALNRLNLNNKDIIIMPYGWNLLYKYYPVNEKARIAKFNIFEFAHSNNKILYDDSLAKRLNKNNAKEILKDYVLSPLPIKPLENYFKNEIFKSVPKGGHVVVILAPVLLEDFNIAHNEQTYREIELYQLLKSKITKDVMNICFENLTFKGTLQPNTWLIAIFEKK